MSRRFRINESGCELVDVDSGQPVTPAEVADAFKELSAIGIPVRAISPDAPVSRGTVVGFTPWNVFVHAETPGSDEVRIESVKREIFFYLYGLEDL